MKNTASLIITILVIGGIIWFGLSQKPVPMSEVPLTNSTSLSYSCDAGKTISAVFTEGATISAAGPDLPPTPGGSVVLDLSDGRHLTLAQTLSADGTRYANPDESFVFWSKGNGALVLENNQEKSYIGCIQVVKDPGNLSQIYSNSAQGFSIRLPERYVTDAKHVYQNLGPGKDIYGTKFSIPTTLTTGTNLSTDSYISVEQIPKLESCTADHFVDTANGGKAQTITDGDTTYSLAMTSDAGAGNRYEESVYAIPGTNPCMAVRYFIHYGAFENYPTGSIKEFDKAALLATFDTIRHTLTINQ